MDSDNQRVIYCEDGEYRVYCDVCDNFCLKQIYTNNLKTKTHINNIREREHFK